MKIVRGKMSPNKCQARILTIRPPQCNSNRNKETDGVGSTSCGERQGMHTED